VNHAVLEALDTRCDQKTLAQVVGLSEARISQLMKDGVMQRGDTLGEQILAYCENIREVAGGRSPGEGELDPAQEKAKLDRERRMGQRIKNLQSLGEWAAIPLLSKTLAKASAAMASKLEALPGELMKVAPDLPFEVVEAMRKAIAKARNDWVSDTEELDLSDDPDPDSEDDEEGEG
jgi:phage terminase Nu1 subunit (DNA packaging protein)